MPENSRRLLSWGIASALLVIIALVVQSLWPGNVLAVTLYKAHLLSLGGWGGYWLDRVLFPYDRPHTYLEEPEEVFEASAGIEPFAMATAIAPTYGLAMVRRAIIVAAALICVGLGA
ncbi:putative holin [Variovorax paradoxus]|uniref:Uncharacterized protein n=1 Tax=Variovorax paradoxus TaxID=34073 RepID=A0A0H2LWT5_VARPD|nr:putative holin [Variovorax paradoxus]KLN54703.1 hypothetical protein VPARA_40070 [Variovorax paradoxus]